MPHKQNDQPEERGRNVSTRQPTNNKARMPEARHRHGPEAYGGPQESRPRCSASGRDTKKALDPESAPSPAHPDHQVNVDFCI
ncbi:hypothetical protein GQ54DRAFT_30666 [Martensiomyces pterosporus]|nr:hypothetical protein GQ54DRAFT_30666 [Martensiomyces pterosporus]